MTGPRTIDAPHTHDPRKQAPMKLSTFEQPAGSLPATRDFPYTGALEVRQNRTREMQLIPEALARAHMHERMREAELARPGLRILAARRMQRRAERASMRARRALALAVMQ
ncbi:hypothetical protein [Streptomyces fragilis]|uniref:Uncharacterized protein n=1 Tax=Streptomyces fragilis TaxID=67301 RepID=A0ABV2YM32_9ACTN|nr:hypothetical protein [Streptomyces fragilis]